MHQAIPVGSIVHPTKEGGPDVQLIEHNPDGTYKLALREKNGTEHYLNVAPDTVALSRERTELFKREAAQQVAVERASRTRKVTHVAD